MMNITNATATTPRPATYGVADRNPYAVRPAECKHGRVTRAGMSLVEMIAWLVIMAVLSLGMIWLLWKTGN